MSEGHVKLMHDLDVLGEMAAEMDEYLMSDVLFWPMVKGDMPRLTIGGYLLRQHRLTLLQELLDTSQQERLRLATGRFHQALHERVVRFEERAHKELHARLRQWGEYLRDLRSDVRAHAGYYASSVETRAIIAALLDFLAVPPYRLDAQVAKEVAALDANLHGRWQPGDFVWPLEWQPAYPKETYWWLYGQPR